MCVLWLFLHHLFLVSLSVQPPCLGAVCDVGFENNKCLDAFRCHVKPGEGHAPSKTSTGIGWGVFDPTPPQGQVLGQHVSGQAVHSQ